MTSIPALEEQGAVTETEDGTDWKGISIT